MIGMPPYIRGQEDMTPEEYNNAVGEWYSKLFDERERKRMSYTPPERTPRKPPSVWKSEQERKEWKKR